jgi:FkbM family methyltransferase
MLQIVKDTALKLARSAGYDIVPLRDMRERDFAIHLGQLLTRLDIDCVFDVGANVGQYHDFLRERVYYTGTIVSFEPVARHVDVLRDRAKGDRRWRIEPYALGSSPGLASINVMKSDQFSSFLEPDNSAVPGFEGLNEAAHVETVEIRTLDQVMPELQKELGFERPYLKLDTQGFDIEALCGGLNMLPWIPALQTEASVIGIYKDMPNYVDTIRFLNERGFEISGLYPISRDESLRLIEFDCVMINRGLDPGSA